jgi:hypothetical protein
MRPKARIPGQQVLWRRQRLDLRTRRTYWSFHVLLLLHLCEPNLGMASDITQLTPGGAS